MGRIFIITCIIALPALLSAQQKDADKLLAKAKQEMRKVEDNEEPDYISAGKWLEEVVKDEPDNAEAWYFYGCAIDRYNHTNSESITDAQEPLTENASLAFENCLRLCNDKYIGEVLVFDPHTKILLAWGTQALQYAYADNRDSAEWCLKQAAQRGGINKTVAAYFKEVLDECTWGGYLFTTGDMYTYYMMYLQWIGHYRPDVTCIDLNLLDTYWYPVWLQDKEAVQYDSANDVGQVKTMAWETKDISIPNKNPDYHESAVLWQLKPTQGNKLTRAGQLLLNILQQNAFLKPVYFAGDVPGGMMLFLNDYMQCKGLTFRLLPYKNATFETELASRLKRLPVLPGPPASYLNSRDNIQVLNNYRFAYTTAAIIASQNGYPEEATQLIETAERKYPESILPFIADATRQWFAELKKKAQDGAKL